MKISFANVQHAYARLAPRERSFVLAGGIAALCVIVFLVVHSFQSAKASLRQGIVAKQRQIEQLQTLRVQYAALKKQADEIVTKSAEQSASGPYAQLESLVTKTITRDKIRSMDQTQTSKPIGDRYLEDSIKVELLGVTLQQTVGLLYEIEQSTTPIHVSGLQMKKRVADPYQFDVIFTVSSVKANA